MCKLIFLYTNNELSERKVKEKIPFKMASKRIKYKIHANKFKEMKDLRTENYKTLMKVIEEDTNKWKDIPCLWIGRISLKCPYYPKQSIDSMQSLPNYQRYFSQTQNKQS